MGANSFLSEFVPFRKGGKNYTYRIVLKEQLTIVISNIVVSKYPHISKNKFGAHFLFLKNFYWFFRYRTLGPENLHRGIGSLREISTLRYQKLTEYP